GMPHAVCRNCCRWLALRHRPDGGLSAFPAVRTADLSLLWAAASGRDSLYLDHPAAAQAAPGNRGCRGSPVKQRSIVVGLKPGQRSKTAGDGLSAIGIKAFRTAIGAPAARGHRLDAGTQQLLRGKRGQIRPPLAFALRILSEI